MLGICKYYQEAKAHNIYMYRCEEYAGNPSYKRRKYTIRNIALTVSSSPEKEQRRVLLLVLLCLPVVKRWPPASGRV
jgi:hypothetical protein